MLYLSKADMEAVFTMRDAFDAVREAFSIYTAGRAQVPLRSSVDIATREAQVLFMPAFADDAVGVKVVGFYPSNAAIGKPVTPATMFLFDETTGELACVMDGTYLTQLRTAAAAGLATELLATPGARVAALIGLGGQAPCQLEALFQAAPGLEEVRLFDLDATRRTAFTEKYKREGVHLLPVNSADEAVSGAQLITTVTTATAPVFSFDALDKGVHVNAIGSYTHEMQELPEELVASCDLLVFDTVHGVMSESGDILKPLEKGLLAGKNLEIEMGHVIAGTHKRNAASDITVYKGVGSGVMDVVTAAALFKKACAAGVGTSI